MTSIDIFLLVFGLLCGTGFYYFCKSNTKNSINSKSIERKTPVGKVDDAGWKQEHQEVVDKVEKKDLPQGVSSSDISSDVKVEIKVDATTVHKKDSKAFAKTMREKYLLILIVLITFISHAETIPIDREDLTVMIEKIERLGEIEESKPIFQLSPIEFLYDSDGRIYTKPVLTGTMNLHDLSYKLNAELKVTAIHKRKRQQGKVFSVSALYCNELRNNHKESITWGLAGTIELWTIRPLIFATPKSYGIGLRLPIYGNAGFLIGADYPSWTPRFGLLFKL